MKNTTNSKSSDRPHPLVTGVTANISKSNNLENVSLTSDLDNENNKKTRFPIAENNIIGFK